MSLMRFIKGWLRPAVEQVPEPRGDQSSMAELARLLEVDPAAPTVIDNPLTETPDSPGV